MQLENAAAAALRFGPAIAVIVVELRGLAERGEFFHKFASSTDDQERIEQKKRVGESRKTISADK